MRIGSLSVPAVIWIELAVRKGLAKCLLEHIGMAVCGVSEDADFARASTAITAPSVAFVFVTRLI